METKSRSSVWKPLFSSVMVLAAWTAAASGLATPPDPSLRISHEARALHPGEAVLLRIEDGASLDRLEARVFEKRFPCFRSGDSNQWLSLIGIDLDVQPGLYTVELHGRSLSGLERSGTYALNIEPKEFPTRRLRVDEKFVTPPSEVLQRIDRESAQTSSIFAKTSGTRHWTGDFLAPVPGPATSSFGSRSILNGRPRSPHSGADFRAAEGTPIKAPNHGKVALAADHYFSGLIIIIDHGLGLYSYFAHLSELGVEEGQVVRKGDVVGRVGKTGRVTGPHLHWTLRLGEARVDPVALLTLSQSWGL